MRSLQLALRRQWDHVDQSQMVEWSQEVHRDLSWWLDHDRLKLGISLEQVSPQLELWSDASDVGWGAHLDKQVASGLWAPEDAKLSINVRELLAIERALPWFAPHLVGSSLAIFADNSTAIAYLRNQGGTHSSLLNSIAQRILRWAESLPVVISPQFIMGKHNVLADALSRPNQILGSGWTLKQEVFRDLCKRWPVSIDLFATSQNHRCSIYISPYHDHNALGTDALLQNWNRWQAYAFPPWSLIPAVLKKLRSSSGVPADHHSSVLALEAVVSGSARFGGRRSGRSSTVQGSSATAPLPSVPSGSVQAVASCLETIKRFTRAGGFSKHVAQQVSLARRPSSRAGYQSKWLVYRLWCRLEGHSTSRPSLAKIADFLFWLHRSRQLSVSAVMGYRSMLSAVFKSILPGISSFPTIHDLLRSFYVEAPVREVRPPAWDLPTVLNYLRSSPFEPLSSASLRDLSRKTLFLLSLATAKRVRELQALSRRVSFSSSAAGLSYVPEFVAKTESACRPLLRSFEVKSLGDFAAGLPEDLLLCPVRSLSAYLTRTSGIANRPRRLFVSSKCPSRAMSKNGISYMLREVIVQSGASSQSGQVPRAHSIRGIATSSAFFRNWSLRSVLEAASWRSNTVFTSFYLRDLSFNSDGVHSLGPFVAAGERIG